MQFTVCICVEPGNMYSTPLWWICCLSCIDVINMDVCQKKIQMSYISVVSIYMACHSCSLMVDIIVEDFFAWIFCSRSTVKVITQNHLLFNRFSAKLLAVVGKWNKIDFWFYFDSVGLKGTWSSGIWLVESRTKRSRNNV